MANFIAGLGPQVVGGGFPESQPISFVSLNLEAKIRFWNQPNLPQENPNSLVTIFKQSL